MWWSIHRLIVHSENKTFNHLISIIQDSITNYTNPWCYTRLSIEVCSSPQTINVWNLMRLQTWNFLQTWHTVLKLILTSSVKVKHSLGWVGCILSHWLMYILRCFSMKSPSSSTYSRLQLISGVKGSFKRVSLKFRWALWEPEEFHRDFHCQLKLKGSFRPAPWALRFHLELHTQSTSNKLKGRFIKLQYSLG